MKTIAEMWSSYQRDVVPKGASATQIQETRRAYYAAIFYFIRMLEEIGEDHVSEEQGVAYLEARKTEAMNFAVEVAAGKA